MKILITGGCGFVGSNLALFLNSKGFIVETAGDADVYFQGGGKLDIGSVTAKELYEIGVQQVSGSNSVVHVVY